MTKTLETEDEPPFESALLSAVQRAVDVGDLSAARKACEAARQERPRSASPLRHLALIEALSGNSEGAKKLATLATEIDPRDPRGWTELGRIHAAHGDWAASIAASERAVKVTPSHVDAWFNLGNAHMRIGRIELAFEALKRALSIDPRRADCYLSIGHLLMDVGQEEDAKGCFERAAKYDDGRLEAASKLGLRHSEWGQVKDAVKSFRLALSRDPKDANAWFGLGRAQEDMGERQEAALSYRRALSANPGHGMALSQLLMIGGPELEPQIIAHAEQALGADSTPDGAKALVGYGLAKHYDRHGPVEDAARAGRAANAARLRSYPRHDPDSLARRVDDIIRQTYDTGKGHFSDQPVFVVGLPRSGTTLTEQILSAHPMVFGAGELPDLSRIALDLQSGRLDGIDAAPDAYLTRLTRDAPKDIARITDKLPLNFFHLGLASRLFSNARVIHCQRDARDRALSIWMENFAVEQPWSTDFEALADYTRQYLRLMEHWRSACSLPILDVVYEETVADTETQARSLIDFLGLPWDPACLDFHRTGRTVQTPSRWQVRQPIYTRSVGRWDRYADALPDLVTAFKEL